MVKGDTLGHEFMGIVESVGPEVQNIKPGMRVVVAFPIAMEPVATASAASSPFATQQTTASS